MHTSTGAVLPLSKVVPIMMLPNRMENSQGAVVGYCSILSELCAVSVPALTDKPDNTAVTMAHELGHFFSIPSDHDGGSGPLFPGYRLMAGGLKRRPITRDKNNISSFDQNPDATGKHFIFSDGICVRMLRGNYVTPIPSH